MAKTAEKIIASQSESVALDSIKLYHQNPRVGNVDAIAESLAINGQYRPIVVQRSSNEILTGNHTWKAAKQLGWPTIQVVYVDVDDKAAKRIVLADNRTSDLSSYDADVLAEVLKGLPDAQGTGYTDEAVADLLKGIKAGQDDLVDSILRPQPVDKADIEWGEGDNSVGGDFAGLEDVEAKDLPFFKEDEEINGGFSLKPNPSYEKVGELHIPPLIPSMLMTPDEVPENLLAWAGSASKDWPDPDQWWLYNFGIDSTSGMKDISKVIMSFYCWDHYFEGWWDYPDRYVSKMLNSGIKYAITPDFSQWSDDPRILSLFNLYRNRWLGRYMQEAGIKVIPNISWRFGEQNYIDNYVRPTLPKKLPVVAMQLQTFDKDMSKEDREDLKRLMEHAGQSLDPELTIFYVGKQARPFLEDVKWPGERRIIANRLDALGEQAKNREKKKTF